MRADNRVELVGTVAAEPVFVYRMGLRAVYAIRVCVTRLSNVSDILPVYIWEEQRLPFVAVGQRVYIAGEMRSFSQYTAGKNKLILYVQAMRIVPCEQSDSNFVRLIGQIAQAPVLRRTPFGREICDVMLTVRRNAYKSEFLPIIVWGPVARRVAHLHAGETLRLDGRFQSREYEKRMPDGAIDPRTAYEVSCTHLHENL
jgi:single-stranded DNA-binding protein